MSVRKSLAGFKCGEENLLIPNAQSLMRIDFGEELKTWKLITAITRSTYPRGTWRGEVKGKKLAKAVSER